MGDVELVSVDPSNWQACAAIRPRPGQERFVAPVTYYLCLCHYEAAWQPLAVRRDKDIAGFVMWAVDPEDGSHWIGGLLISADSQRRGYGRGAVATLLERFRSAGATEAALSYARENEAARQLYASFGFTDTGEQVDSEQVARLALRPRCN
jgi:diamine N-acetyltransferase